MTNDCLASNSLVLSYCVEMFATNLLKHISLRLRTNRLISTAFSYRQNLISDLSKENLIETSVSLHGWLQYRRMNSFGVLRDHSGLIQFLLPSSMKDQRQLFKQTPVESCIHIQGLLKQRPQRDINKETKLGHLEVG